MNLINNLIPTKVDDDYLQDKMLNGDNKKVALNRWHFNDKIYAKVYFKMNDISYNNYSYNYNKEPDSRWHSVICKSKYYYQFRSKANSSFDYIIEFYTDKDFEINPVWESIYTNE
jgi:hypothetical protein